jgi:hypothetical protein
MALSLLGINTVSLQTISDDGFSPSLQNCLALITLKTKAIALITPNNLVSQLIQFSRISFTTSTYKQTGAIYSPSLIADSLIWLMSTSEFQP